MQMSDGIILFVFDGYFLILSMVHSKDNIGKSFSLPSKMKICEGFVKSIFF